MDEVLATVIQLYIRTNKVLIELQEFTENFWMQGPLESKVVCAKNLPLQDSSSSCLEVPRGL